jgi:hypothetical protein
MRFFLPQRSFIDLFSFLAMFFVFGRCQNLGFLVPPLCLHCAKFASLRLDKELLVEGPAACLVRSELVKYFW